MSDLDDLGFKRIFIVPEGLNFAPLKSMPEKANSPVIVYSGRLKRAKRPDHAIKAFRIVKEKIPKAELWIIGDGPFRKDLEKMSCKDVKFYGSVDSDQRRELIKKSWVLVNPSVREGWGLNVTEANALGVPAVAYSAPGLVDSVCNGETGLVVESGDFHALSDGILKLLTDFNLREQYSRTALDLSRAFSWENTSKTFMSILDENK